MDVQHLAELLQVSDHATQNQLLRNYENWLFNLSILVGINTFTAVLTLIYLATHNR